MRFIIFLKHSWHESRIKIVQQDILSKLFIVLFVLFPGIVKNNSKRNNRGVFYSSRIKLDDTSPYIIRYLLVTFLLLYRGAGRSFCRVELEEGQSTIF